MNRSSSQTSIISAVLLFLQVFAWSATSYGSPWKWQASLQLPDKNGRLLHPAAILVDEVRQRFYISDTGNNRLVAFDLNGGFLDEFNPEKILNKPGCLLRTAEGIFLVCEAERTGLTLIDPKAQRIEHIGLATTEGEVIPRKIKATDDSYLVLDRFSGNLFVFDTSFQPRGAISRPDCEFGFIDFALHGDRIFALHRQSGIISVYAPDGNLLQTITLDTALQLPYSLAVDDTDRLFVLDRSANAITVFTMDGKFAYSFLSKGNSQGKLFFPAELQFDHLGRLLVLDEGNGRVEIYQR